MSRGLASLSKGVLGRRSSLGLECSFALGPELIVPSLGGKDATVIG